MNRDEFRRALARHRISPGEFAELIGRSPQQVYTFGQQYPVPYYARVILRLIDERGGVHGLVPPKLRTRYQETSDQQQETPPRI